MANKLWERQKNGYLKYIGDDEPVKNQNCEECANLARAYRASFCRENRNPSECNDFYYDCIYNQFNHYWNDKNEASGWNLSNEQRSREWEIVEKNYPGYDYSRAVTFEIVIEQTLF